MDTKECSKCGEVKPLTEFYKNGANLRPDCKLCVKARTAEKYRKNRGNRIISMKAWYQANREEVIKRNAAYAKENREQSLATGRRSYQNNKQAHAAKNRKREAAKIQRTASWANDQLIAACYKEAKRLEELTGIQFHVDHIIPLQGELVSGLHVETNLQLLPAHENLGKSNSFNPETFCA